MIEKLTPKQERQLIEFREECRAVGLATGKADLDAIRPVINRWYGVIGKGEPYLWRCESPATAQLVINFLRANLRANLWANLGANLRANLRANLWDNLWANLGDKYIQTDFWGSLDVYWVAFYLFPLKYIGRFYSETDERTLLEWDVLSKNSFWLYPFDGICFVCDRPTYIGQDDRHRLHSDERAAIEFSDGWKMYYWHGVQIPERAVTDIGSYTAKEILAEKNTEVRRALMSLYGYERILPEVDAKLIDSHPDPTIGELYEFFIGDQKHHVAMVQDGTPMYKEKGKKVYRKYAIPTRTSLNDIVSSLKDTYPLYRGLTNDQYLSIPRT